MIRQQIKKEEYFDRYLISGKSNIERGFEMLSTGKVIDSQINSFKKGQFDLMLNYTVSNYTAGKQEEEVKKNLLATIDYSKKSWSPEIILLNSNGKLYNQYSQNYDQMLWMLSLGYLLDIDKADFIKLVEIIDRDGVKDYLFEFIIRAKLNDRKPITEESYKDFFGIPDAFAKLRQTITETDKSIAEKLVKEFITKDWVKYKKQLGGGLESHKSKHDTYFGYWSFETAAVVKIMNLDDSSFIDCQYYPKDLVHQDIENC